MRRRTRPTTAIGALLAALLLCGCAASVPAASSGEPIGRWGAVVDDEPHAEFDADGTVVVHDGCNGGGGRWSQRGVESAVLLSGMGTTFMACVDQGPHLATARTADVSGDVLVLLDEQDEVLAALPRSAR